MHKHQPEEAQHEKIKALLAEWDTHAKDIPDEWWDNFQEFLQENRVDFDRHQDEAV